MLKNIIFDFDGVIRKINNVPLKDIFEEKGIKYDGRRYRDRRLNEFFTNNPLLSHLFAAWDIGFNDLNFLAKQSSIILNEREEVVRAIYEAVIDTKYNHSIKETIDLIKDLHKEGFNLYIFSNLNPHVRDTAKYLVDFSLFKDTLFSCDAKMEKPNLDYYIYLIKKCKIEPEESLFIDDNKNNLKNFYLMNGNVFLFHSDKPQESVKELRQLINDLK